jgi:leader peptidase (prepilin peptidase)/N-methyltransferase
VPSPLIAALALAGLAAGWPQRIIIFRYAVPPSAPPRTACPTCVPPAPSISSTLPAPPIFSASSTLSTPLVPSDPLTPSISSAPPTPSAWLRTFSGRCPACGVRTGPPALAVAVITAILLGTLAARVHPGLVLAAACWLAACAVPLAFIDAAVRRLPDRLTAAAYAGTVVFLATTGHWPSLLRAILGGLVLAGFYLALLLISPSAMGLGDVKLAASLGTLLAWFGWRTLIAGGAAGFLLAGLFGIILLVSGRATRKQHIPFGPFLIAGAFLMFLL